MHIKFFYTKAAMITQHDEYPVACYHSDPAKLHLCLFVACSTMQTGALVKLVQNVGDMECPIVHGVLNADAGKVLNTQ